MTERASIHPLRRMRAVDMLVPGPHEGPRIRRPNCGRCCQAIRGRPTCTLPKHCRIDCSRNGRGCMSTLWWWIDLSVWWRVVLCCDERPEEKMSTDLLSHACTLGTESDMSAGSLHIHPPFQGCYDDSDCDHWLFTSLLRIHPSSVGTVSMSANTRDVVQLVTSKHDARPTSTSSSQSCFGLHQQHHGYCEGASRQGDTCSTL